MKKTRLLNADLSRTVAEMGHTDGLCIADAGLPIPFEGNAPLRIDLAVSPGVPAFIDVLAAVLSEMVVERVVLAEEMREKNPAIQAAILKCIKDRPIEYVSHEALKTLTHSNRAIVRTGECTPYANIILYSGVPF